MEPTQTTGGKTGVTIAFDFLGERHQVELVQERYRDGNLAVTAYTSDPASEDFASPWTSVTVNLPWFEQEGATVLLDENNMSRAVFEKVAELGTFTGGYDLSGEARDMGAAKDGLSAPGATELPDRDGPTL